MPSCGEKCWCKTCHAEKNKRNARERKYHLNRDPEKVRIAARAYYLRKKERSPGYYSQKEILRRERVKQLQPLWANQFFIDEAYDLATRRTETTGTPWEVDHILPLRGKAVSGLHVETNLRVIPRSENRRKFNNAVL